jgi:hypothetical protein
LFFPAVAVAAGAGFDGFNNLVVGRSSGFRRGLVTAIVGLVVIGFSLFQRQLYLFQFTPTDVCRFLYKGDPFPESLEIAKYLKQHSSPGDTVAVIGSEPQIYFYSNRRAATHYIYMYPLMEVHDYASAMQNEMIGEIESAKPEWIVFVNDWVAKPGSVKLIFKWLGSYCPKFYDRVGIVDIFPTGQTVYHWDQQVANYTPTSDLWATVYKRKH